MTAFDIVSRTAARLGVPIGRLGNVVVIPGILGSDLVDGTGRHLWLIPPLLEELSLNEDGTGESIADRTVHPTDANIVYAPLIHALEPFWNVLVFAYDWRKSVHETAQLLAATVNDQFGGEAFHIVAHSLGGLVARVMLNDNPAIQRGGRLIMLGTPNHGSVLAVTALTSEIGAAAFFDCFGLTIPPIHALAASRTWPSSYQLLPCPSRDPKSASIYEVASPGLSQMHLAVAQQLHADLDAMPGTDLMAYIAGSNVPTVDGDRLPTLKGDGIVSHRLGFLDGVQTFIIIGDHISLPANPLLLASITPLLHNGNSGLLR